MAPKSSSVVLFATLLGQVNARIYTENFDSQRELWEQFKKDFSKNYEDHQEEHFRFSVFLDTLRLIDERNEKETGTAVHGITKFADLSVDEFKKGYLNYRPSQSHGLNKTKFDAVPKITETSYYADDTMDVDWTGVYTTPVKDQGYCGSCWAFSVTEQIESDYWRQKGVEYELSAQQITSCTSYASAGVGGCNGGDPEDGFAYAFNGIELESDYPYTSGSTAVTGDCDSDSSKFVVKTVDYGNVASGASDETNMAYYVASTGPVSVVVDASSWSSYTGGIMSTCGTSLDHAVQAVGLNTQDGYWKIRNTWGTSWGESGFIRIAYGANMCGVASDANFCDTSAY